jgi:DNA-binding Lrp family transcriptional regulator
MQDLNLKDRKILYQLDLNCRQSNTQIGKKVGLSRQVVDYRINKMENKGIIQNYITVINSYLLGFDAYRYYIKLQNATNKLRDEIGNYIAKYKNTWVCTNAKSIYDLGIVIWVKDIQEFYNFWDDVNNKYGDYFSEKIFSVYIKAHCYPHSYLLGKNYREKDREIFQITAKDKQIKIDKIDYEILNIMALNARIPTVTLAKKINQSSQNTQYRMNHLISKNLIQAFRVNIDISKIGLDHYKVDIFLNHPSKRNMLWETLKHIPEIIFINTSAGYADIELEIIVKSSDEIINMMEKIMDENPALIKKYVYWYADKFYKIRCIPELTMHEIDKKL